MSAETQGSLPEGWTHVRFGDVVRNKNLTTKDPEKDGLDRIVGLTHLDSESLSIVRWDILEGETSFSRAFAAGDVLFGKRRAYQRKVGVPDFAGICSGDILVFESKDSLLLQEFLPYIVQSDAFFERAVGTSAGSLSPRTNWTQLARFEFALPPIEEQKRIVEGISAVDAAAAAQDQLSRSAGELATSLVANLSADEATQELSLCEVAQLYRGATPSTKQREFWDGDIDWFTPSDLTAGQSRRISTSKRQITQVGLDSCSARLVPAGSLLLSTRATIGYPKIADTQCSFNQGVTAIVCGPLVTPEYLQAVLQGMSRELRALGAGSTFPEIPKARLEQMRVPVAVLDDQRRLVTQLESLTRVQEAATISVRNVRELGKSLIEGHGGMSSV